MRRVKTDEKRQEIMAIARQVFRARRAMREIPAWRKFPRAYKGGSSQSTPYSYFPSKEELFIAVMLDIAARNAGAVLDELERADDMRTGLLPPIVEKLMDQLCSPEMIRRFPANADRRGRAFPISVSASTSRVLRCTSKDSPRCLLPRCAQASSDRRTPCRRRCT